MCYRRSTGYALYIQSFDLLGVRCYGLIFLIKENIFINIANLFKISN
jgi:hypothetical protein